MKYTEGDGDQISLKLTGGDVLVLNQAPDDAAPSLEILDRAPGSATLTGSVKRNKRGGDGQTTIDGITGDSIVNRLPATSFIVNMDDTTPPAAPTGLGVTAATDSGSSSTDEITNVTSPTVMGNAEVDSVVRLFVNGTKIGQATSNPGAPGWQIPVGPLAEGPHSFTAMATDAADNVSVLSAPLVVTIDRFASPTRGAGSLSTVMTRSAM